MPSRRATLRGLVGLAGGGLAGCLGPGPTPSGAGSPTASPDDRSPASTTSPGGSSVYTPACSKARRPSVPDPGPGDEVEPREYPELPQRATVETVRPFVRAFERAWLVNHAIEAYALTDFQFVAWGVGTVRETDGGDGVRATVGGHVAPFWEPEGETATPMHYDRTYTAAYLVTGRAVARAAGQGSDAPDPRTGRVVVCSP